MPIITPNVSEELQFQIERAEAMHSFIDKTFPQFPPLDTDERVVVVSLVSLVQEHHAAIMHLLRRRIFDGSAPALVRPLIEGAFRAHWIYAAAKPATVSSIRIGGNCFPGLMTMADQIENKMGTGLRFFRGIEPYIESMHGYTHGGFEQLLRRFDKDGNVTPTYTDQEKRAAIHATTANFTGLAIAWCQLASLEPSERDPRSQAISDHYIEIYGDVRPPTDL